MTPEILEYEGKTIIHIYIPPSSEVHTYKKIIYDRVDDADVKVTSTSQIASLYIRKQNIYTEKKVYPYAKPADFRFDLLSEIRRLAVNHAGGKHPWSSLDDMELIATKNSFITPDNLEPNAKNPIIASFFRTIDWSDQLGSGVRNLFKYANLYSGKDPIFKEGDIFQIVIPLAETFSFDKEIGSDTIQNTIDTNLDTIPDTINTNSVDFLERNIEKILDCIKEKPDITRAELGKKLNISLVSVKRAMKELYRRVLL